MPAINDLELAAIVAAATLLGAALGGVIAAIGSVLVERQSARREQDRERDAARGIARVLYADLFRAEWSLNVALKHRCWWPQEERLAPASLGETNRLALATDSLRMSGTQSSWRTLRCELPTLIGQWRRRIASMETPSMAGAASAPSPETQPTPFPCSPRDSREGSSRSEGAVSVCRDRGRARRVRQRPH